MKTDSEKGYPLLFFSTQGIWWKSRLALLISAGGGVLVYLAYIALSKDRWPGGMMGLVFALLGTTCMLFSAVSFTLRKRARKRGIGQLNAALNWHVSIGLLGLVMLFLHAFGSFGAKSGDFALYALVGLVISGLVGRMLDQIVPRLMAQEVNKALTAQGEDRIESISQQLRSIVAHNTQELRSFKTDGMVSMAGIPGEGVMQKGMKGPTVQPDSKPSLVLQTPWDLAYISLDELPQEMRHNTPHHRFVPDKKSPLARPGALIPGAREHMSELSHAQQALQHEQTYRYIIRYWRMFHTGLALLTLGLTAWHVQYALTLLLPIWMHR